MPETSDPAQALLDMYTAYAQHTERTRILQQRAEAHFDAANELLEAKLGSHALDLVKSIREIPTSLRTSVNPHLYGILFDWRAIEQLGPSPRPNLNAYYHCSVTVAERSDSGVFATPIRAYRISDGQWEQVGAVSEASGTIIPGGPQSEADTFWLEAKRSHRLRLFGRMAVRYAVQPVTYEGKPLVDMQLD